MKSRIVRAAILSVSLLAASGTLAQTPVKVDSSTIPNPLTAPAAPDHVTSGATLPDVDWQPTNTVSDILDYLRNQFPGTSFVLVRTPNTPENVPLGTCVQMKNATLEQLLNVLQLAHPGLTLSPVDASGRQNLVGPASMPPGFPAPPPQPPPSMWIAHLDDPQPTPQEKVQVFDLYPLVGTHVEGGHTQQAMDDVLSVINAALQAQAAGGPSPTLQVHVPTNTLLVRGTEEQLALVQQTLLTLTSRDPGIVRVNNDDWRQIVKKLQELDELKARDKAATAAGSAEPSTHPSH